jgi:threonine 3-dehydrogenase
VGQQEYRLNIAKKFGADRLLDQKQLGDEGVEKEIRKDLERFYEGRYGADVVLEMVGAEETIALGLRLVRKGGRVSAFGLTKKLKIELEYNDGIVFKGVDIRGINGRLLFDTWYLMRNLLNSGKLDISPILTHKLPLKDFAEGFRLMDDWPRECGKVVFLPWG